MIKRTLIVIAWVLGLTVVPYWIGGFVTEAIFGGIPLTGNAFMDASFKPMVGLFALVVGVLVIALFVCIAELILRVIYYIIYGQ